MLSLRLRLVVSSLALSVIASDATSPKGRGWPCNNKNHPSLLSRSEG